jgi:hypothetical protein
MHTRPICNKLNSTPGLSVKVILQERNKEALIIKQHFPHLYVRGDIIFMYHHP